MGSGYTPGPWDPDFDQYVVDDGTMCRVPTPRPAPVCSVAQADLFAAPKEPPPPEVTVIVIGSPSKDQKFQYQFVDAAKCRSRDANTIWLVEKTGYEIYGVTLDYITRLAPQGGYGWITPKEPLVGWLNHFKDGVIKNLVVFSHGLRGLISLRYGWEDAGAANYGLRVDEVEKIDPKKFAASPTVELDSCNSGVPEASGGQSVASALAGHLHVSVGAWTGRTSYADINAGGCTVRGSGQTHNPFSKETWSELWSRHKAGGAPEFKVFPPPG